MERPVKYHKGRADSHVIPRTLWHYPNEIADKLVSKAQSFMELQREPDGIFTEVKFRAKMSDQDEQK